MTEDAGALARLSGELGYPATDDQMLKRLGQILSSSEHAVFVASQDSIVGWIHVAETLSLESGRGVEILGLIVAKRCRGNGIGALLVSEAEHWAQQHGLVRIRVRTNVLREEAKAFYAQMGYREAKQQAVYDKRL